MHAKSMTRQHTIPYRNMPQSHFNCMHHELLFIDVSILISLLPEFALSITCAVTFKKKKRPATELYLSNSGIIHSKKVFKQITRIATDFMYIKWTVKDDESVYNDRECNTKPNIVIYLLVVNFEFAPKCQWPTRRVIWIKPNSWYWNFIIAFFMHSWSLWLN